MILQPTNNQISYVNNNPNHTPLTIHTNFNPPPRTPSSNTTNDIPYSLRAHYNDEDAITKDIIDTNEAKRLYRSLHNDNIYTQTILSEEPTSTKSLDYVKIGSVNIRGKYPKSKQNIISFFQEHNFDILGLTELCLIKNHLFDYTLNYCTNTTELDHNQRITIIHDLNGSPQDPASGCAIILSEKFAKHYSKVQHYKGRVLSIDLHFRKKHHIRLINTYLPAKSDSTYLQIMKDCHLHIDSLIKDGTNKKMQIILMGDYNANVQKLSSNTDPTHRNKKHIFNITKSHGLKDVLKSFNDTQHTYHSGTNSSRINYIHTTDALLNATFHAHVIKDTKNFIIMNHHAIVMIMDYDYFFPYSNNQIKLKSQRPVQTINYSKISASNKQKYKDSSETIVTQEKEKMTLRTHKFLKDNNHVSAIENIWYFVKEKINILKKQHFPSKNIYNKSQSMDLPLFLRQQRKEINKLHQILMKFNKKRIYCSRIQTTSQNRPS